MTYKEMAKKATEEMAGNLHVELMGKARQMANNGTFTDNREEWDENDQYLIADIEDIVDAHYNDLAIKEVLGIDPTEKDDGAEAWCKRHNIELLG